MIVIRLTGKNETELNTAADGIIALPGLVVESDTGILAGRRDLLRYIYARVKATADPENQPPSKRRRP